MGGGGGTVSQLRRRCSQKGVMRVIGRSQLAEGLDRIGIVTSRVLCPTEVTPETLGMIGVEPHRSTNPLDPFFGASEPGQQLALLHDNEVAVRIEAKSTFLVINRLVVFVEVQFEGSEDSMHIGIVVVERESCLQLIGNNLHASIRILAPTTPPRLPSHARLPSMSMCILRIEFDGAVQHTKCFDIGLAIGQIVQNLARQQIFVCRHTFGTLSLRAVMPCSLDAAKQCRDDCRRHTSSWMSKMSSSFRS